MEAQAHDPSMSDAKTNRADLLAAWNGERSAARTARQQGDQAQEWWHLERAHILSQPMAAPHVRTHVAMLAAGVRRRDPKEITGQLVRLVVAGPGSLTGRYPVGNTGGAHVPALATMAIPADLRAVLAGADEEVAA
jgi:hypothetical protein